MDREKFYKAFWVNYLQIEKELIESFKYVELSVDNYNTYSSKFLKIFLQVGSEIDVCFKEYIKLISTNNRCENIIDYKNELLNNDMDFFDEEVNCNTINILIKPWNDLQNNNNLCWWTAYNKVKHQRTDQITINNITKESYKFANLENVIFSLAGLYILLMNIFSKINGYNDDSPVPNSKLFKMNSPRWSNCKFFDSVYASLGSNNDLHMYTTEYYIFD